MSQAAAHFQIQVQGLDGQVLYDGVQPTYPGVDQINLQLPKDTLPAGTDSVTVQIGAPSANEPVTYQLNAN